MCMFLSVLNSPFISIPQSYKLCDWSALALELSDSQSLDNGKDEQWNNPEITWKGSQYKFVFTLLLAENSQVTHKGADHLSLQ